MPIVCTVAMTQLWLQFSYAMQITGGIDSGYSSIALHPDGQILGTGTEDATVHVWETKSQNVSAMLSLLLCLVLKSLCWHNSFCSALTLKIKLQSVSITSCMLLYVNCALQPFACV